MSLLVWLPLNRDYRSNGLKNISVTNYNTTINSYDCVITNNAINYLKLAGFDASGLQELTVACWAKPTTNSLKGLFSICTSNNYWQYTLHDGIEIRDDSTGVSGTRKTFDYGSIEANKWIHICCIYNHGTIKIFKNGILYATYNTGGSTLNSGTDTCYIGASLPTSTTYIYSGEVRDFKIYDHELSLKEIKELSNGLYVNYSLNDPYIESSPNLLSSLTVGNLTTVVTSTSLGSGKYHLKITKNPSWNPSPGLGTFRIYIPLNILQGHEADLFFYQFKYKLTSGTGNFIRFDWCDNANVKIVKKIITDEYTLVVLKMPTFSSTKYNSTYRFLDVNSVSIGDEYDIWDLKFEMNSHWTPYLKLSESTSSIIYDCTGFENDATLTTGELLSAENSSRYSNCMHFELSRVTSKEIDFPGNIPFTIMCWVRLTTSQNYLPVFWMGNGTTAYGICMHGGLANRLEGGKTSVVTKAFDSTMGSLALNTWKHIAITWDGENLRRYYNGVLSLTIAWSTVFENTFKRIYLGYFWGGKIKGDLSDFRLYSTCLSNNDIKDVLTLVSLDNIGNLYSYEFNESTLYLDTSMNIKKTGVFHIENVIEDNTLANIQTKMKKGGILIVANQIKEK